MIVEWFQKESVLWLVSEIVSSSNLVHLINYLGYVPSVYTNSHLKVSLKRI